MTKPIVIVSIVILLGLGYFAWQSNQVSDVNNTETEPQAEVNNIVNDSSNNLDVNIDENKNKSEVKEEKEKDIISSKSHEIVNPITGESHPASYYDEVLADGYTYNNPAPIPEDWIIEPATDEYPATIDFQNFNDNASDSYFLQGNLSEIFTMIPDYMSGYSPRLMIIKKGEFNNKEEFMNWFSSNYDTNFYFVKKFKKDNSENSIYWNILLSESNIERTLEIYSDISKNTYLDIFPSLHYLPKYRGTQELQDYYNATMNSVIE